MFLLYLLGCWASIQFGFLSVVVVFVVVVFKLLLSFFWLCEEAQCVYLRLHLGRKNKIFFKKEKILSQEPLADFAFISHWPNLGLMPIPKTITMKSQLHKGNEIYHNWDQNRCW